MAEDKYQVAAKQISKNCRQYAGTELVKFTRCIEGAAIGIEDSLMSGDDKKKLMGALKEQEVHITYPV